MTGGAPDVPTAVIGWRTWQIRDPELARLRSPVQVATEWPGGSPLTAVCELRGHPAPDPDCTCGLYAARRPADVGGVGFGRVTVLGCVALWGTVVEGERGWRAGVGIPVVLFCGPALDPAARAELAAAHRVPVHPLALPVAPTVELCGIDDAAERVRAAASAVPPDPRLLRDAARGFATAAGGRAADRIVAGPQVVRHARRRLSSRSPAPTSQSYVGSGGRVGRRFTLGAAVLAALAVSALALPQSDDGDPPVPPTSTR